MSDEERLDGPIILGVEWNFSEHLIRTAASEGASPEEWVALAATFLEEMGVPSTDAADM
jgi:hypothetical protein